MRVGLWSESFQQLDLAVFNDNYVFFPLKVKDNLSFINNEVDNKNNEK